MGLTQLNFEGENRIEVAIKRLQYHEPQDGYYLAFSGGKDSVVIYDLALKAGVKFDAHYHRTGIDPPELVQFIGDHYHNLTVEKPEMSIWRLLVEQHGLPRRQGRWCCEELKEGGGKGRTVITGIRWAESPRRARRGIYELCQSDGTKHYLNPIIDWSTAEVWDYIRSNKLPYCSLYDEGFKRLGCVLCPMITARETQREMARWPKLAEAWHRATVRFFERGTPGSARFESAEHLWRWWISRKAEPKTDAQCVMFE